MSNSKPMVEVRDVHKAYGALEVLKGINLSVERGQIIAIIGPSGSGKSTLLRSINHLETVNSGQILLDGVQVNQSLSGRAFERHINAVRQQGGRIVAVGTTSVRTLESAAQKAQPGNAVAPFSGPTNLFILPGYTFRAVDVMITNFHLPKSTLIMLVSAFAGRERILSAYQTAIEMQYRFFSFGDAMLIL